MSHLNKEKVRETDFFSKKFGIKSEKMGGTEGKFFKLKVDERNWEKRHQYFTRENKRSCEIKAVSHLNKGKVWETVFFSEIWEKVKENGRKSKKMGETKKIL